jgi:hydroxyacid-oxoacid transhydrogenase
MASGMSAPVEAPRETRFTVGFANLVVGPGATQELGDHAAELGLRRVMVVTDPRLIDLPPVAIARESLAAAGIEAELYADVQVEPTDGSFQQAATAAAEAGVDGFVAVGGGSTIDTAKAADLYSTYPASFLEYVNAPIGSGKPPPGPLRPLIAIPTTAGTGSETTGVAIFDLPELHAKTGIAHRRLRPTLGIVDPDNVRTVPPMVAAAAGFDVLCHALESYTALPYRERERPERPGLRPAYQGANPFSDLWAEHAIAAVGRFLGRLVADAADDQARTAMCLAATYAGIGFGNAGVHLPHGMSYAVSGQIRSYVAPGYPVERPLVPHGMSVVLTAPAVFRYTGQASPERHRRAAGLLGAPTSDMPADAGEALAARLIELMRETGIPNGLSAVGYAEEDAPALAEGTLPQHRVTRLAPRRADRDDLEALFRAALRYW